ncbi:interleukin-12 subunit alpha [Sarcophilus harrisii]
MQGMRSGGAPAFRQKQGPVMNPAGAGIGETWVRMAQFGYHATLDTFLIAILIGLSQVNWVKSIPVIQSEPSMHQYLRGSKNLLGTVTETLQQARQKLELYSCSLEEIDHEDITESNTGRVCLPPELIKLCLKSIYKDLETYKTEFKVVEETLAKDPTRQISLDQNMLAAIDEMMQALNFSSENMTVTPSPKEPDFYKAKVKLCLLLHAFRIRVVTIDRMRNYLCFLKDSSPSGFRSLG